MRLSNLFAPVIATGMIVPAVALAQSADPAWLDTVSEQLARDEQCLVEYYVNIREGELAGRKTYEARAQCRDGRQFDAVRTEPEAQFTVRLCEVQVC
ncbi:MAG: hypothetical protein ABL307_02925 [Roseitalea porphyridii]|uniref:hypothetical protein n=1 Tax=Roseitalea porphyridii TaxID=1852022 RepID=UPI0032D8CACA